MIRTIFVPITLELPNETLLDAALLFAEKLDAHIRAVFIRPDPNAIPVFPEILDGALGTYAELERKLDQAGGDARRRFDTWCGQRGLAAGVVPGSAGCSGSWSEVPGEIGTVVTRFGRVNDLIAVRRPATTSPSAQSCFDAAVFGSGRPTIVIAEQAPAQTADHVMIAWNGSIEATRAVASAMPILHLAKRVSIFTALKYGINAGDLGDLAEALRWHGIHTPEVFFPRRGERTGAALIDAIEQQKATMVVMGAYTHSRLRQSFLGGVTAHLLGHAKVPLLMCH
jgi:nucleotide-binding universal stress UspA family protein